MHTVTRSALVLALALVVAACGVDDDEPDPDLQARVAELEAERDEAQREAEELARENEQLEAELEALREEDPDEEPAEPREEPAPMRTEEGLVEQLHLLFEQDLPEGFDPGSTDWEPFDLPEGVAGTYDEPGEVGAALLEEQHAAGLGLDVWEATTRVLLDPDDPDVARVAVLAWGLADDATAGIDVRVTVHRTDEGWEPGEAERRQHCWRGVSNGACV